jgi:hypothetical protein
MTTAKAAAANKANSKKSTGAITPEGKAVVSKNAVKHGLLSRMLIIAGEDAQDFDILLVRLMQSIAAEGMLEQVLVEKVAVALWRQRRLVAAESAAIELSRMMESSPNQSAINKALNLYSGNFGEDGSFKMADLEPIDKDSAELMPWCKDVLAEFQALDDEVLEDEDLNRLAKEAPLMFAELSGEAKEAAKTLAGYTKGRLIEVTNSLHDYCEGMVVSNTRKFKIQTAAAQVQAQASAPVTNELLARYSAGLDNELYRAIEALRKQQEFRLKHGVIVDVVEAA